MEPNHRESAERCVRFGATRWHHKTSEIYRFNTVCLQPCGNRESQRGGTGKCNTEMGPTCFADVSKRLSKVPVRSQR